MKADYTIFQEYNCNIVLYVRLWFLYYLVIVKDKISNSINSYFLDIYIQTIVCFLNSNLCL